MLNRDRLYRDDEVTDNTYRCSTRPHAFCRISCLLALLLVVSSFASASSTLKFPAVDEGDLPFFLEKLPSSAAPHLHVFGSISFLSHRLPAAAFALSRTAVPGLVPLATLDILPPLDSTLQPEFFDVTIWGQLGNLFNKTVESLALEQEIIALFRELQRLNENYIALIGSATTAQHAQALPMTLNQAHYLQRTQPSGHADAQLDPLGLIQHHDNEAEPERLVARLLSANLRSPSLTGSGFASSPRQAVAARQEAEPAGGIPDNYMVRFFRMFKAVIHYMLHNKLEALIYLSLLALFGVSIKTVFTRQL